MEELIEIAKHFLEQKKFYGDIYLQNIIKNEVNVNDSKVEKITKSDILCGNIRVFKNGKMGFCYFTGGEKNIIEDAVSKAIALTYIDGYETYSFNFNTQDKIPDVFDKTYKKLNDEKRIDLALQLEKYTKEDIKIKMVRDVNFTDVLEKVFYINSEGQQNYYEKTGFFVYTSAIAQDDDNKEIAENFRNTVLLNEIDVKDVGRECAKKAVNLLGGSKIKSGKYKIMIPPEIGCDLLSLISKIFLGDNIIKGKSLLALNQYGDSIASTILTIKDDALLDFRSGSFAVDADGVPGKNKIVVENGILKTFLFDKLSASGYNTNSTGNAIRTNFKFLPECGVSNFYIDNGKESKKDIIKNFTGIYINSLMGLHMADTVSGNFSLAFNGWLLEKGEKTKSIKESLITGNIKDLLKKIIIICDDLKFYANYGSPTMVIDDMEVAGE